MTKQLFLDDTTMPILFQGGDTDYINAAIGNINKYNAWLERLSDDSEIIEIKTRNITNLFTQDNFPFDDEITKKAILLNSYINNQFNQI